MGSDRSLLVMVQPNILRQRAVHRGQTQGELDPICTFAGKEL